MLMSIRTTWDQERADAKVIWDFKVIDCLAGGETVDGQQHMLRLEDQSRWDWSTEPEISKKYNEAEAVIVPFSSETRKEKLDQRLSGWKTCDTVSSLQSYQSEQKDLCRVSQVLLKPYLTYLWQRRDGRLLKTKTVSSEVIRREEKSQ